MPFYTMDDMARALAAYTAYTQATGGIAQATGRPMPRWAELPDATRFAWAAAALAAASYPRG